MSTNFAQIALILGLPLSQVQLEQFDLYCQELIAWNHKMNLTAIIDPAEIELKHFADSLSLLLGLDINCIQPGYRVMDVGSGAGFPGLVLKIAFPQIDVTLLDSRLKRGLFLKHMINLLGLTNAVPVTGRAEELAHQTSHREQYDLVVSRAVAGLDTLSELCLPFCRLNGLFAAYKKGDIGKEVQMASRAINAAGGRLNGCVPVNLEGLGGERFIVIIEKIIPAPPSLPRRSGVPSKHPL
jgi:16S rRNA (guanine527-N7)-methyltransferase